MVPEQVRIDSRWWLALPGADRSRIQAPFAAPPR